MKNQTNRKVITLCGPYRFKDEMWKAYLDLTARGHIVLLPAYDADMTIEEKHALHNDKILNSDEIFVVDVNGYVGEDTRREIEFARYVNIPVTYLWGES